MPSTLFRAVSTLALLSVLLLSPTSKAKIFSKCELAQKLDSLGATKGDIPTWVCIAEHESRYNSSVVGPPNWDGSRDHGVFQINDRYWCYVGEEAPAACGLPCSDFEDDDIADDFVCARRVFRATKKRTGNGFTAWAVYAPHCAGPSTKDYVNDC
uniref:lysozyme n=1 Tax=Dialeurodes citri TaxID=298404 RepID=A0A385NEX3_DIACT|nr:c-type lysozyme [Dialeurodes citri]